MSFPYSHEEAKKGAIEVKIRRAITQSKGNINPDFDKDHADWVRQGQNKNYTDLKIKIKDLMIKKQARAMARRAKLVGK